MLDVKSSDKGVHTRLTFAQRNAIVSPANGLMVYQTDNTPPAFITMQEPLQARHGRLWAPAQDGDCQVTAGLLLHPTISGQPIILSHLR